MQFFFFFKNYVEIFGKNIRPQYTFFAVFFSLQTFYFMKNMIPGKIAE